MENMEKQAIDLILENGIIIHVKKRSILRYVGKKERTFRITASYLSTLYKISGYAVDILIDSEKLQKNAVNESMLLVSKHAKDISKVLAIAIINDNFIFNPFAGLFARYLMRRLDPAKSNDYMEYVLTLCNLLAFMNTIRSVASVRMTQANNLSPKDSGG